MFRNPRIQGRSVVDVNALSFIASLTFLNCQFEGWVGSGIDGATTRSGRSDCGSVSQSRT